MCSESEIVSQQERLLSLIREGRVPIAPQNVEFVPQPQHCDRDNCIVAKSADADLTIFGFTLPHLKRAGAKLLTGLSELGNVLFVTTSHEIELMNDEELSETERTGPAPGAETCEDGADDKPL
jgi:hypothetical protein